MGAFLVFMCQPLFLLSHYLGLHIQIRRRHFIRDNQRAVAQAGPVLWACAAATRCLFARGGSQRGCPPLVVFPPFLPAERGPARRAKRVWGHTPKSREAILWLKAEPCPPGQNGLCPLGQHSGMRRPGPQGTTPPPEEATARRIISITPLKAELCRKQQNEF